MNNEKIARKVTNIVFKPKNSGDDPDFAVQLLVEKLLIPKEIGNYSFNEAEENILKHLNRSNMKIDSIQNQTFTYNQLLKVAECCYQIGYEKANKRHQSQEKMKQSISDILHKELRRLL